MLFHKGQIHDVEITAIPRHADERGWLAELFRADQGQHAPAMVYVSMTYPGVVRGPHEHSEQTDLFAFIGPGVFRLQLWDFRHDSPTHAVTQTIIAGETYPCTVRIPPGVAHGYRNIGDVAGLVINMPDRLYAGHGRESPIDEIRHEGRLHVDTGAAT